MSIANFEGKKVLICYIEKSINELAEGKPYRKTLLDCVCKYWEIPNISKANDANFVIGVGADKKILIVAKLNEKGWQLIGDSPNLKKSMPSNDKLLKRYGFEGDDISNLAEFKHYIGQTLPSHIKFRKDISFPLYCENGEILNW